MGDIWHKVAQSSELTVDAPLGCVVDGIAVGLYRSADGPTAIGDICPHEGNIRLTEGWLENGTIECPMHQAVFDIRSGKCMGGPTNKDVPRFDVREEDGALFVKVEQG